MRLSNKFLGQGYVKERLKSSLRKFYGNLIRQYEPPLSFWRMTIYIYILHWSDFTPILILLLISTLLPNLTFYLIVRGFPRTFATVATCQQRTLTPPDTWSCPTLDLAGVLMLRPIYWTCLVSGLLSFEHPSVLLFCFTLLHVHVEWLCCTLEMTIVLDPGPEFERYRMTEGSSLSGGQF